MVFVYIIELSFDVADFAVQVDAFNVSIVELSVQVLVIVNPSADHMRVLFVERNVGWFWVYSHLFVEPKVVRCERLVSPKHVFAPQVRVLSALMHRSIRLEVLLNIQVVLLKRQLDFLGVRVLSKNLVEVSAHSILLIVEPIEVSASDSVNVLRHQLPKHGLVHARHLLRLRQTRGVLGRVGKQVVYLLEGEVLAIIVSL